MRDGRHGYKVSVGKPEGKRMLGISRRRWRIIFKLFFKKWNGKSWAGLISLRLGIGDGRL
jgi:hypothetical protein